MLIQELWGVLQYAPCSVVKNSAPHLSVLSVIVPPGYGNADNIKSDESDESGLWPAGHLD